MTLRNLERRFKVAYLPENALVSCLSLSPSIPGDCLVKYSLDVPPETIVVSRNYEFQRQAEAVVLWNKEWPILDQAQLLPEIKVNTQYLIVKGDTPRRESSCDQPLIRNAGTFTIEVKNQDGVTVKTMTFENPITVEKGQTLILSGFNLNSGEMVGEGRLTGTYEETRSAEEVLVKEIGPNGSVGFKINTEALKGIRNPCGEIEAEFFDPALGEPHANPFDKTWREKEPLL
jgi:hypothetical protein